MIFYLLLIYFFALGTCIGSFLNVVIYRLEQEKNIYGFSYCPHCKHPLSWLDLVPVFSFIFLQGRCRYCSKKISLQYPLVEAITGIIFILAFIRGWPMVNPASVLHLVFLWYIFSSLMVIFVFDLKHYIIPDVVLFPLIITTIVYRIFEAVVWHMGPVQLALNYGLAGGLASAFFLVIFLVSAGRWMGFGDVKLAFFMGVLLGLQNVTVALFLAFVLGAIVGLCLMVLKQKNIKSEIPFGPFLIVGSAIALFSGQSIATWYLH